MKNYLFISLLICLGFSSCTPEKDSEDEPVINNEYYIEGKVDGGLLHATYTCPYSNCVETSGYYLEDMQMIQIYRRMSLNDYRAWEIIIENVDLNTLTVPTTITPSGTEENPLYFDVTYYTQASNLSPGWISDGISLGENSFTVTITSKTNDILEGTFSGTLRSGSDFDLTKTITEGKFKIKLYRM